MTCTNKKLKQYIFKFPLKMKKSQKNTYIKPGILWLFWIFRLFRPNCTIISNDY